MFIFIVVNLWILSTFIFNVFRAIAFIMLVDSQSFPAIVSAVILTCLREPFLRTPGLSALTKHSFLSGNNTGSCCSSTWLDALSEVPLGDSVASEMSRSPHHPASPLPHLLGLSFRSSGLKKMPPTTKLLESRLPAAGFAGKPAHCCSTFPEFHLYLT